VATNCPSHHSDKRLDPWLDRRFLIHDGTFSGISTVIPVVPAVAMVMCFVSAVHAEVDKRASNSTA